MRSKRTKACAISEKTKRIVSKRDDGLCIFCCRYGKPEAHIIPRSHGGLGVPKNIITVCRECHDKLDNSTAREKMLKEAIIYLKGFYPDWNEKDLIYSKWAKREKDKVLESPSDTKTSKMADLKRNFAEKPQKVKDNTPPEGFYFLED